MAAPSLPPQTPPGTSTNFQSIRSSCDRCRFHKLKCAVPAAAGSDGHRPCQRCARAKVECVFGRRRRGSHVSEAKRRPQTTVINNKASLADPITPSTSSGPSPFAVAGPDIEPRVESGMYEVQDWDGIQLQGVMDMVTDFAHGIGSYELQDAGRLDDIFPFDADRSHATRQSSPTEQCHNHPVDGMAMNRDSSSMVQQLLALLSEMQQRLEMLKKGPWQFGSVYGLDNYPIGAVLHLSQQFSGMVGPVLRGTREPLHEDTRNPLASGCEGTAMDALETVLVLSGCMLLMRIYSIVLAHFQTHLDQMPSHGQALARRTASPTLRLGELPCANAAHGLGRIHTALCMLQESLNGVEGQLGRGGVVAGDMVMALLRKEAMLSSGNLQDGGGGGLSRQATAVRGLLREKMSL